MLTLIKWNGWKDHILPELEKKMKKNEKATDTLKRLKKDKASLPRPDGK